MSDLRTPPRRTEPERSTGLLVGRPFGVPVYVSPTWILVAALITWAFAPQIEARLPGVGAGAYLVSFAFAVLLYASVLLHELSHSVVALHFRLPVRRITLHVLGGVSEITEEPRTPGQDFLVAAAGPAVSLGIAGAGWAGMQVLPAGSVVAVLVGELTLANLLVGIFNLLPGLPLDGGRLLSALVWRLRGDRLAGAVVAGWAGRILAAVVFLIPLAFFSQSVVNVVWGALLASFIWVGANQSLASARLRERLPSLSARSLTRRALPVHSGLPVSEAVRQAIDAGAQAMVVVDTEGRPVGLVSDAAVSATPPQQRPWVDVGTLSRRIDPAGVLTADLSGESLVRRLAENPAPEYLVVDAAGLVYGVLVTADVERAFAGQR